MTRPVDSRMGQELQSYIDLFLLPDTNYTGDYSLKLLQDWRERAFSEQQAHLEEARSFSKSHQTLGVGVIVFSTLVGTSVFATLETDVTLWIQIIVGMVSVCAAVLAALQTFLRYSERAEKHQTAAANYGKIRREIDQKLVMKMDHKEEIKEEDISSLREQYNFISQNAPNISLQTWDKVDKILNHLKTEIEVQ